MIFAHLSFEAVAQPLLMTLQMRPSPSQKIAQIFILLFLGVVGTSAVTLEQLQKEPDLTPEKFAGYFSNFQFIYRVDVQEPARFLASRSGDCDDYAVLAAMVLKQKGYTPRLIAVRMPGLVHVVCYIEETQSYLDYNYRSSNQAMKCAPGIEMIASEVAKSYQARWSSASEFTFERGLKRLVATVLEDQGPVASTLAGVAR